MYSNSTIGNAKNFNITTSTVLISKNIYLNLLSFHLKDDNFIEKRRISDTSNTLDNTVVSNKKMLVITHSG